MDFLLFCLIAYIISLIFQTQKKQAQEKDARLRALQISDIDYMNGIEFEHYVAKLLTYQGFHTEVTRASGDFGVDIIATKLPKKYAIQVKRQSANVSRRAVSDAVAGESYYGCNEAMVITNSYFTAGAKSLAKSNRCRLVDRDELTNWIIAFQNRKQVINANSPLEAKFQAWEMAEEIKRLKQKMRSFFH